MARRKQTSSKQSGTGLFSSSHILVTLFAATVFVFVTTIVIIASRIEDTERGGLRFFLHDLNSASSDLAPKVPSDVTETTQKPEKNAEEELSYAFPHIYPKTPVLPPFATIDVNEEMLISDTLSGKHATMAGVHALLNRHLQKLHDKFEYYHSLPFSNQPDKLATEVVEFVFNLTAEHLGSFDEAFRGKPIFPIREDGSIFISLASYRDHMLGNTLKGAFRKAANPDKIFVGAVVQNCFGKGIQCRTGVEVKGTNKMGRPITKVSDAPPDKNGIEEFCTDGEFKKYCDAGHIRALYVNETESLGPAVARYFASKLWGGETYFMQADAHLQFAPNWDNYYIEDVKSAKSYPKAVLSAYPPGFSQGDPDYVGGTTGTRLCQCEFSQSDVEHKIIRINTGNSCKNDKVSGPTQIAFIAAGFFFAHAGFLTDVPFDPYMPWCFMGEEIALSLRAWTQGWGIYAPKKNWIAHQYRPGRMGLPKFWETVGRVFNRPGPGFNTRLQKIVIQRIKHMVGYPEITEEWVAQNSNPIVLRDMKYYGAGSVRPRDDYIKLVNIDYKTQQCRHMKWCNSCQLE
eukprot:CAMPEP_0172515650 /NCGR_PEP_ID=MMETSP1066-20121228/269627_1 /TAXON_ID=671091 /ORGANISM="Coscinodiscus wailesii, Strain CCMP2513" /LENGTH=570 /DNA_ID=CAMNT_0013296781 /DNA_START=45 /DNA_END=1757 /DNA_ORIENTATION=-